jgi:hypothetical protein
VLTLEVEYKRLSLSGMCGIVGRMTMTSTPMPRMRILPRLSESSSRNIFEFVHFSMSIVNSIEFFANSDLSSRGNGMDSTNILVLPHTAVGKSGWEGSRHDQLCKFLHSAGWSVSLATWERRHLSKSMLQTDSIVENAYGGRTHSVGMPPNYVRWALHQTGYASQSSLALNQALWSRHVSRVITIEKPALVLAASSHYFTGFPKVKFEQPLVFDYLDLCPDHVVKWFTSRAQHVLASSTALAQHAKICGAESISLVPNGVWRRPWTVTRASAKYQLGLPEGPVVSLIGLTTSPTLYFVDAFATVLRTHPSASLVLVGDGKVEEAVKSRVHDLGLEESVTFAGHLPHEKARLFFRATDVGLAPGDDAPYYRLCQPIKVVEYLDAGVPVVCSPVDDYVGLSGVTFAKADVQDFAEKILGVLEQSPTIADKDLTQYSWEEIGRQMDRTLRSAIQATDVTIG